MEHITLALFGVLAGLLAGIFGLGGGTLIVPTMMATGISIKYAIGISIMQMMFSSVYGTILNIKTKLLNFKIAFFIALGGMFGASFSGFIVHNVEETYLKLSFTAICFYSIFKVIKKRDSKKEIAKSIDQRKVKFVLLTIGFITGIFSISLGIGGGMIIVPLVSYYLNLPIRNTVPISLFFVMFSSISGFTTLAFYNYVNYKDGLIVGLFSLIGVYFGTKINNKLPVKIHKIAVITLYSIILCYMLYSIIK